MNRYWAGAFAGCMAVMIAFASSAAPPQTLSFGAGRPVPAGNAVFGGHTFHAICWACHSHDLSGGKAPPLTGPKFYKTWQGKQVDALSDFILNRMPQDDPGSLSEPMARDLVAYIVTYANNPKSLAAEKTGK